MLIIGVNFMHRYIDINVCYRIIFNALSEGKGPQFITDALFDYTRMPIHVVDVSFRVLAASFINTTGSKHIDKMISLKAVPSDVVINEYYKLGYINEVEKNENSYIVDWGVVEVPQACGAIRVNGIIEGICATTFDDPILKETALLVNDILIKALKIEFERKKLTIQYSTDTAHQVIAREIFKDILQGAIGSNNRDFIDFTRLKPKYEIVIVTFGVRSDLRIQQACNTLIAAYPNEFHVFIEGYLYIFFTSINTKEDETHIFNILIDISQKHQCFCGLSGVFSNFYNKTDFRFKAQKALEIGQILNPHKRVYLFDEYYLEIVAAAALSLGKASYLLPEFERLFNAEHFKDYYLTLKTYLFLGNNIGLTAAKLHIHRNTLIYRITKIQDIMGVDLNDPSIIRRLIVSITMNYIYKSIRNNGTNIETPDEFWNRL